MKRLWILAALLTAFLIPATSFAWLGPTPLTEDSASLDTFYVSGNADVDTSEVISWPGAGEDDLFAEVCIYSDSMEVTIMVEQRMFASGIKDLDTSFTRATWNVTDSINVTGLSERTCSLWAVTMVVPPVDTRFLVVGRNGNKVGTGGGTGGTAVIISYFREEKRE